MRLISLVIALIFISECYSFRQILKASRSKFLSSAVNDADDKSNKLLSKKIGTVVLTTLLSLNTIFPHPSMNNLAVNAAGTTGTERPKYLKGEF